MVMSCMHFPHECPHVSIAACTDMALAYCQDVPYRHIMFPNIVGHRNRVEAELGAEYLLLSVLHGLLNGECSEELRLLGCSVLAPRCHDGRMLKPCRTSCEAVRRGCSHAFEGIDMAWPYFLDCDRFFVSNQEGCYDPLSEFKGRLLDLPWKEQPCPNADNHSLMVWELAYPLALTFATGTAAKTLYLITMLLWIEASVKYNVIVNYRARQLS